jgi:hypothetical protein
MSKCGNSDCVCCVIPFISLSYNSLVGSVGLTYLKCVKKCIILFSLQSAEFIVLKCVAHSDKYMSSFVFILPEGTCLLICW